MENQLIPRLNQGTSIMYELPKYLSPQTVIKNPINIHDLSLEYVLNPENRLNRTQKKVLKNYLQTLDKESVNEYYALVKIKIALKRTMAQEKKSQQESTGQVQIIDHSNLSRTSTEDTLENPVITQGSILSKGAKKKVQNMQNQIFLIE